MRQRYGLLSYTRDTRSGFSFTPKIQGLVSRLHQEYRVLVYEGLASQLPHCYFSDIWRQCFLALLHWPLAESRPQSILTVNDRGPLARAASVNEFDIMQRFSQMNPGNMSLRCKLAALLNLHCFINLQRLSDRGDCVWQEDRPANNISSWRFLWYRVQLKDRAQDPTLCISISQPWFHIIASWPFVGRARYEPPGRIPPEDLPAEHPT